MLRYEEFYCDLLFGRSESVFETLQIEGRFETLILAEEGIALKIPVGADYIESPGTSMRKCFLGDKVADIVELFGGAGGKFYTVKWTKDREGRLRIYDYSPDCIEGTI